MYVLFVCYLTQQFVLRQIKHHDSYDPPDEDGNWTCIDDSIQGHMDALVVMVGKARSEGWADYTLIVQDAEA